MATLDFNVALVRPYTSAPVILPPGKYTVAITSEQIVDLSNGRGTALAFNYTVKEGPQKGAVVRELLNLWHTSQDAVTMARSRLAAIVKAVGLQQLGDTTVLQNRPFCVQVSCREWNGREYNNVDDYLPYTPNVQQAQQPQAPMPYEQQAAHAQTAPTPQPAQTLSRGDLNNKLMEENGWF